MQTVNLMVALGGDKGNRVPLYNVTAAEVAVLRQIHGDESISDVEPTGTAKGVDAKAEVHRLREKYAGAYNEDRVRHVDIVYPGAGATGVTSVKSLDLPDEAFKTKTRASAEEMIDVGPPLAPGTDHEIPPRQGRARRGDRDLTSKSPGELLQRYEPEKIGDPVAADDPDDDFLK